MMLFERPEVLLLSAAIPIALIYVFAHILFQLEIYAYIQDLQNFYPLLL